MAGKTEYKQAWAREHLERIILDVPPKFKEEVRAAAAAAGQGMTAYTVQAVRERMERDAATGKES